RVLVAVSGGPDSTALLSLLCRLAPEMRLELHVAHLDHGWRGRASAADAEFVRRMALRFGLPVTVGRVDPRTWLVRERRQSSREVIAYLRDQRLRYRVDATNRDTTLARNRVRRRLLPLLGREFNPSVVDAVAQAADLLRDEDAYLTRVSETEYRSLSRRHGQA